MVTFNGKSNKFHIIIIYAYPATSQANVDRNKMLYADVQAYNETVSKSDVLITLLDANATLLKDGDIEFPVKRVLFGPNKARANANSPSSENS